MESQQRGLSLLHVQIQFHTMKLTTQNRARGDREHMNRIHRMRTSANPIDDEFLQSLKVLTAEDMKDERWHFAPIVVTNNGTLRKLTLPDLESVSGSDEDEDLEIVD